MGDTATQHRHGESPGEVMRPDMELALAARAENIAIVRHALGGFGEAYDVPDSTLADIRLAVTEACANVVVHAYPEGHEGPMEVVAKMDEQALTVLVRDWGRGIGPRPDSPGLGLGLSLIAALAESVQLGHDHEEHTEVRMTFALGDGVPGMEAVESMEAMENMRTLSGTSSQPGTNTQSTMNTQLGTNGWYS
jgi:serine/threonine-protein kinase RsbW